MEPKNITPVASDEEEEFEFDVSGFSIADDSKADESKGEFPSPDPFGGDDLEIFDADKVIPGKVKDNYKSIVSQFVESAPVVPNLFLFPYSGETNKSLNEVSETNDNKPTTLGDLGYYFNSTKKVSFLVSSEMIMGAKVANGNSVFIPNGATAAMIMAAQAKAESTKKVQNFLHCYLTEKDGNDLITLHCNSSWEALMKEFNDFDTSFGVNLRCTSIIYHMVKYVNVISKSGVTLPQEFTEIWYSPNFMKFAASMTGIKEKKTPVASIFSKTSSFTKLIKLLCDKILTRVDGVAGTSIYERIWRSVLEEVEIPLKKDSAGTNARVLSLKVNVTKGKETTVYGVSYDKDTLTASIVDNVHFLPSRAFVGLLDLEVGGITGKYNLRHLAVGPQTKIMGVARIGLNNKPLAYSTFVDHPGVDIDDEFIKVVPTGSGGPKSALSSF